MGISNSQIDFAVGDSHQDQLFEVLSHPHRRFTLQYLRTAETPLPVGELVSELDEWEDGRAAVGGRDAGRDSIEIALLHSHLPKMDDAGLVGFDATRGTVMLADPDDEVQIHVQGMADD